MATPRVCRCSERGCKHFLGPIGPLLQAEFICDAYQSGIPNEIVTGEDDHSKMRGDETAPMTYEPGGVKR